MTYILFNLLAGSRQGEVRAQALAKRMRGRDVTKLDAAAFLRRAGAGTGGIAFLGLLPEYRGLGLAAQLLGCAVSEFRKEGLSRLVLLQAPPAGGAERFFARFDLRGPEGISLIPVFR